VTERIASTHPKSGREKIGSNQALQILFGLDKPEEKTGTVTFVPLAIHPKKAKEIGFDPHTGRCCEV